MKMSVSPRQQMSVRKAIWSIKVIGFDDRGKVKLSMKRVDQETGADLEEGEKR